MNLLELIDKCVGLRIWVVMKGEKGMCLLWMVDELCWCEVIEFSGIFMGFDDYVSECCDLFVVKVNC